MSQSMDIEVEPALSPAAHAPSDRSFLSFLADLARLAKPRLSSLVLMTTAGGLWLAPGEVSGFTAAVTMVMTTLAVASANTLNCYLERETDGLMKRTRTRPLPSGRVSPRTALFLGLGLAAVSVPSLVWLVNPVAGALGALAIASYVLAYTPMKYRTPHAVTMGTLPGAIPPLLGWSAVTGGLEAGGLALFALMAVWQIPHFLAIALYLRDDYRRAGIRVVALTHGVRTTIAWMCVTAVLLLPASLSLVPLGIAGWGYGVVAALTGIAFIAWTFAGLLGSGSRRWARRSMLLSIVHLSVLFLALAVFRP